MKLKKRQPLMPPSACPVCGSEAIRSQGEQYDDELHFCHMYCLANDDHQWTETYTFTSYERTEE